MARALRPGRRDHALEPLRAVGHRGISHLRRAVRGLGRHIGQLVPEARSQVSAEKDRGPAHRMRLLPDRGNHVRRLLSCALIRLAKVKGNLGER